MRSKEGRNDGKNWEKSGPHPRRAGLETRVGRWRLVDIGAAGRRDARQRSRRGARHRTSGRVASGRGSRGGSESRERVLSPGRANQEAWRRAGGQRGGQRGSQGASVTAGHAATHRSTLLQPLRLIRHPRPTPHFLLSPLPFPLSLPFLSTSPMLFSPSCLRVSSLSYRIIQTSVLPRDRKNLHGLQQG